MINNNNSRVQDLFSYKNESNNIVKISNDEQLPEALIFLSNNKNEKLACFLNKKFKTLDSETINKILTNVFEKSIQNESMDGFCPKFLSLDVWEKLGKPNEIAEVWFQLDKLQIHEVTTNSKLKKILKKGLIYSLFFNIILRSGNLLIKDIKNNKFFFFNDSILYSILKKVTYFTLCFSTAYLVVGSLILIIKSLNLYFNQKK